MDELNLWVSNASKIRQLNYQYLDFIVGDGRQGYDADGPYNAIHVGAAAPTLPQAVWITKQKVRVYANFFFLSL